MSFFTQMAQMVLYHKVHKGINIILVVSALFL
jgi:hypothetical protein